MDGGIIQVQGAYQNEIFCDSFACCTKFWTNAKIWSLEYCELGGLKHFIPFGWNMDTMFLKIPSRSYSAGIPLRKVLADM